MTSLDFCFISFSFVSKLALKVFTVLIKNFSWKRFLNVVTDSEDEFFWNKRSTASTLIFAYSTTLSVRRRFMLFIYFFEGMTPFSLYRLSSCSNFLSQRAIDIAFFSEKHSQKINVDFERFMIEFGSDISFCMIKFLKNGTRSFKDVKWSAFSKGQKSESEWIQLLKSRRVQDSISTSQISSDEDDVEKIKLSNEDFRL